MPITDLCAEITAIKWTVGTEKTDKRSTYSLISPELKIISSTYPYVVNLEERPYETAGITITGFTEVLVMPTANNQFYTDYEDSTIYFYSGQAGELVSIYYYGTGSVVAAEDMNRFANFLCSVKDFLTSFLIEPSDPADTNVNLTGGYINTGTELVFIPDEIMKFGAGQEYVVSATTVFYWRKLLVSVNISTEDMVVTEGSEASTQAGAAIPSVPSNCKPCAIISAQDDGNAGAGTIQNISSGNIEDVRAIIHD
ncbi:hypothetical protein KAR91_75205 [Candidatus Pacearchaeota archaeon]|nr:hypothetical protein [Candidatus Pacearchaeota archaeon]